MALAAQTAVERWAVATEKDCPRCYKTLPIENFQFRKTGNKAGFPMSYCKECRAHRQKLRYDAGAYMKVTRKWQLKNKYGITQEDYNRMLEEQGGVCKICGTDDPKTPRGYVTFAIDHNHETGKVRGLLCNPCNRALGLFKDDPDIMKTAISYLLAKQAGG